MKPFEYGCVVKDEMFCPRPVLETELRRYMENGQNVVVYGERRIGKTSLIMSAFNHAKGCRLIYVDLLNIRTISDFCDRVASAASRMGRTNGFVTRVLGFLARLRPTLSVDPQNGMPVVSVDARLAENVSSFEDVISMIERLASKDRVVVVFDEFQEILKLDDPNAALAVLRSKIQFLSDTCFVFSGSVRTDMVRIFTDYQSPFYKSAASLNVSTIADNDFIDFLQKRFTVGRRRASRGFLLQVLETANRVSGDVQQLCDAIWSTSEENAELGTDDLAAGITQILKQDGASFAIQTEHLTRYQMKALRGIAQLGGQHVYSADFIERAGLSSAPTAKRAIEKLIGLGILYYHDDEYRIFNPFLIEWLRRH